MKSWLGRFKDKVLFLNWCLLYGTKLAKQIRQGEIEYIQVSFGGNTKIKYRQNPRQGEE